MFMRRGILELISSQDTAFRCPEHGGLDRRRGRKIERRTYPQCGIGLFIRPGGLEGLQCSRSLLREKPLLLLPPAAKKRRVQNLDGDFRAAREREELPLIDDGVGVSNETPSLHDQRFRHIPLGPWLPASGSLMINMTLPRLPAGKKLSVGWEKGASRPARRLESLTYP